jgi:RNA polymerase-binding transcription factor DksA
MEQVQVNIGELLKEKLEKKVRALQELEKDALEAAGSAGHGDFGDLSRKEEEGRLRSIRIKKISEDLKKIEAALARYKKDPEKYGICKGCGDRICLPRMIAWPETEHCEPCKAEIEQNSPSRMTPAYKSA